MEPQPENIEGTKRVVHKVEHGIEWHYVVAGLAVIAVAWLMYVWVVPKNEDAALGTEV